MEYIAKFCKRGVLTLSEYMDALGIRCSTGLEKLSFVDYSVQLLSFAVKCNLEGFFQSLLEFEAGSLVYNKSNLTQLFKFSIDTKRFNISDRIVRFVKANDMNIYGNLLNPLHFAFDHRYLWCNGAKET